MTRTPTRSYQFND